VAPDPAAPPCWLLPEPELPEPLDCAVAGIATSATTAAAAAAVVKVLFILFCSFC